MRDKILHEAYEISIHALREEGDRTVERTLKALEAFLSTPSARRATNGYDAGSERCSISIHALREEGDAGWSSWTESSA